MSDRLSELTRELVAFRDAREWKQFHSLKNLCISLNIETAELMEIMQWKKDEECESLADSGHANERIASECADVLSYLLLIAHRCRIDLASAVRSKMALNEQRYPVAKSKGSARKYNDLD
jgi:NTP pyrophosphatase (non-canonical NTP hydrolase)